MIETSTRTVTTRHTVKQEYNLLDLADLLGLTGDLSKGNLRIYVSIPSGGDYSGEDLEITRSGSVTLNVEWEEVQIEETEPEHIFNRKFP